MPFENEDSGWTPGGPEYLRLWSSSQLLLASDHPGLQAQNLSGQWIEVSPCPYTFVINFGKGLESVTQGLVRATSHRVLVPPAGSSPRYSIPFFQNIAQGVRLSEHVLEFPPEVLRLKGLRGELGETDCEFTAATVATANLPERTAHSGKFQ
ncbi:hypothetical protein EDB92DRAFT_1906057 [Lactarius akahatsu]|uniref:Isopenicillin N synthase-like Fe(2+) 2OG dioxygenase domain-containing protein n=1 Tax=Lactarius akahatsu TaxID=416441 RepID=A0AAD4L448_9AGAM|nr:hypothetical protein EDB92DRAFT_1906057 [Lactarius akahatsu]